MKIIGKQIIEVNEEIPTEIVIESLKNLYQRKLFSYLESFPYTKGGSLSVYLDMDNGWWHQRVSIYSSLLRRATDEEIQIMESLEKLRQNLK